MRPIKGSAKTTDTNDIVRTTWVHEDIVGVQETLKKNADKQYFRCLRPV